LILKITNDKDQSGLGEIAPLAGLNRETLVAAQEQLIQLRSKVLTTQIPAGLEHCNGQMEQWLGAHHLSPCVRFGVEMAILSLVLINRRMTWADLFGGSRHERIYLNGLLDGNLEHVQIQAKEMLAQGFHSLKLKIGQNSLAEDIERIQAVQDIV